VLTISKSYPLCEGYSVPSDHIAIPIPTQPVSEPIVGPDALGTRGRGIPEARGTALDRHLIMKDQIMDFMGVVQ
jgi:hypothetical protein